MSKTNLGGDAIDRRQMTASLPVSSGTPARKLAGAVWKYSQEGFRVDLRAMGAGALNQAVKALILARMMASAQGKDLYLIPAFQDVQVDGVGRTLLRLYVVVQPLAATLPKPGEPPRDLN